MNDRKYEYEVGQHVIYVDPLGIPRDALVTVWWGDVRTCGDIVDESGCNVAFVEGDAAKKDANGRQVSHSTSVVHRSKQAARGNYWCWDYELDVGQKSMLNTDHR